MPEPPLATTENPSAMPKEFEPLNDWQETRKQKKEEEEKQRNTPDHPETTGRK